MEFFFNKITDADYGTYYWPTTAGFVLLAAIVAIIFLVAVFLSSGDEHRIKVKDLAFCSIAMALAFVTSFMKLYDPPFGGSITLLSMLFIVLTGYWYGLRTGLMVAIAYGMLQLVTDPWIVTIPQVLFDYVFAFASLGLSGLFSRSKHGLIKGYLFGVTFRLLFSFLSGILFFASYAEGTGLSVWLYSIIYNGSYIGGEALLTLVIIALPPVSGALKRVKQLITDNPGT